MAALVHKAAETPALKGMPCQRTVLGALATLQTALDTNFASHNPKFSKIVDAMCIGDFPSWKHEQGRSGITGSQGTRSPSQSCKKHSSHTSSRPGEPHHGCHSEMDLIGVESCSRPRSHTTASCSCPTRSDSNHTSGHGCNEAQLQSHASMHHHDKCGCVCKHSALHCSCNNGVKKRNAGCSVRRHTLTAVWGSPEVHTYHLKVTTKKSKWQVPPYAPTHANAQWGTTWCMCPSAEWLQLHCPSAVHRQHCNPKFQRLPGLHAVESLHVYLQ